MFIHEHVACPCIYPPVNHLPPARHRLSVPSVCAATTCQAVQRRGCTGSAQNKLAVLYSLCCAVSALQTRRCSSQNLLSALHCLCRPSLPGCTTPLRRCAEDSSVRQVRLQRQLTEQLTDSSVQLTHRTSWLCYKASAAPCRGLVGAEAHWPLSLRNVPTRRCRGCRLVGVSCIVQTLVSADTRQSLQRCASVNAADSSASVQRLVGAEAHQSRQRQRCRVVGAEVPWSSFFFPKCAPRPSGHRPGTSCAHVPARYAGEVYYTQ
jgi:hypothetical protein